MKINKLVLSSDGVTDPVTLQIESKKVFLFFIFYNQYIYIQLCLTYYLKRVASCQHHICMFTEIPSCLFRHGTPE